MYTEQICKYIEDNRSNILADIAGLVRIPSIKGEPEDAKPFGKSTAEALEYALDICRKNGFEVKNISNAIGFADMNEFPLELGILAHLDVVPAGGDWESDPFELTYKDGNIYGRGVSDDKGPAVAAIYAMKAVKSLGIPLRKNVRLILGTDEECGSGDLKYYFENEETPKYSFSPDAEFPIINTEKGRFAPRFSAHIYNESQIYPRIIYFDAGNAVNAVPGEAVMRIAGANIDEICNAVDDVKRKTGAIFEVAKEGEYLRVTAKGKPTHASLPETGNNALTAMLELIGNIRLGECASASLLLGLRGLFAHNDWYGKSLGIACGDEIAGKLTVSLNVLHFENDYIYGYFDSRTPLCSNYENTALPVKKALNGIGFEIDEMNLTNAHHVDPESPFIKTLLSVYENYTGKNGECIAIGGGTYVHNIENGVAFGSAMPGVDTNMHGANEYMPFEDIITAAKIYAEAIAQICG